MFQMDRYPNLMFATPSRSLDEIMLQMAVQTLYSLPPLAQGIRLQPCICYPPSMNSLDYILRVDAQSLYLLPRRAQSIKLCVAHTLYLAQLLDVSTHLAGFAAVLPASSTFPPPEDPESILAANRAVC